MKLRRMPLYETDPATGAKTKRMSRKWYAVWMDFSDVLRRLPLFEDRQSSDEAARKINKLNSIRAAGDTIPPELSRYIETMPPAIRGKLADWGLLPASRVTASKSLAAHLEDWKAALLAKGNTPEYAELASGRADKLFEGCGFKFWTDISANKVQIHLAELRQDREVAKGRIVRGQSKQTSNYYLKAAKQFAGWMVRNGRASESPLAHLQPMNTKTDRRHDRRALSADELRWMLDVTEHGYSKLGVEGKSIIMVEPSARFGMTAIERALLYRLAVETGLRAGELRSLTCESFDLYADDASVTISAAYAKNRRQDTLPLRTDTAAQLKEHMKGKMPNAHAFAVPGRTHVAAMFRADLADARTAWLESHQDAHERTEAAKSTFLLAVDDAGRHADFHCLRHSFISNLAAGGVHPKTAQLLARHSTITLTMDRYTHSYRGDLSAALDVLPDLSAPTRQLTVATGTEGATIRLSPGLSPGNEFRRSSVESGGVETQNSAQTKTPDNSGDFANSQGVSASERDGTRTRNHRIDSPVL